MRHTGRCLCGGVAYVWAGEQYWTLHCHCESCRRATSSPIATWIAVPREGFRFTVGQPSYYASSPGVRRGFCGSCGSPMTYENASMSDEVHVLAGTLVDQSNVRPSAHIFVEEEVLWFDAADALPRYLRTRSTQPVRHGPRG